MIREEGYKEGQQAAYVKFVFFRLQQRTLSYCDSRRTSKDTILHLKLK
jgi:hypothetical protein